MLTPEQETLSPMEAAAEVCCGEFEKLSEGQDQIALHVRLLTIAGLNARNQGLEPDVFLSALVKLALANIDFKPKLNSNANFEGRRWTGLTD
jgi:hypothetical protein